MLISFGNYTRSPKHLFIIVFTEVIIESTLKKNRVVKKLLGSFYSPIFQTCEQFPCVLGGL